MSNGDGVDEISSTTHPQGQAISGSDAARDEVPRPLAIAREPIDMSSRWQFTPHSLGRIAGWARLVFTRAHTWAEFASELTATFPNLENRRQANEEIIAYWNGQSFKPRDTVWASRLWEFYQVNGERMCIDINTAAAGCRQLHTSASKGLKVRNEMTEMRLKAEQRYKSAVLSWPEFRVLFECKQSGDRFINLLLAAPVKEAIERLNSVMFLRLKSTTGKQRPTLHYMSNDCEVATKAVKKPIGDPESEMISVEDIRTQAERYELVHNARHNTYSLAGEYPDNDGQDEDGNTPTHEHEVSDKGQVTTTMFVHQPVRTTAHDSDDSIPNSSLVRPGNKRTKTQKLPDVAAVERPTSVASPNKMPSRALDFDSHTTDQSEVEHDVHCDCQVAEDLTKRWTSPVDPKILAELDALHTSGHSRQTSDATIHGLLLRFGECLISAKDSNKYCVRHMCYMVQAIGLHVAKPDRATLTATLYEYSRESARPASGQMHIAETTDTANKGRVSPLRNSLNVHQWHAKDRKDEIDRLIGTEECRQRLMLLAGVTEAQWKDYQDRGTINLPIFDWWREAGILDIAETEFQMYRWHSRGLAVADDSGQLRAMVFSITQQLMRQDIRLWAAHVLFRHSFTWQLVSYPACSQFTVPGERIDFRRLDHNLISMASTGRALRQVQGTLSLDDECYEDCGELVPGMHNRVKWQDWSERLRQRGVSSNLPIRNLSDDLLTSQDLQDFETRWEAVPCKALEVRFTEPAIPQGSRGFGQSTRRYMQPYYMAVHADGENLELSDGESLEDVRASHRRMIPLMMTPFGLADEYGLSPVAFAADTHISQLNPLSDAMVAQRDYNDPEVFDYVRRLLLGSEDEARDMILEFQDKAEAAAKTSYEVVQRKEKTAYGDDSFWRSSESKNANTLDEVFVSTQRPPHNGLSKKHGQDEIGLMSTMAAAESLNLQDTVEDTVGETSEMSDEAMDESPNCKMQ